MPEKMLHIIDELKVGGAQTHLVTMLRQVQKTYPFQHRVVSLFGEGEIGNWLNEIGIEVEALDLRPYFMRQRFGQAVAAIKERIVAYQPDVVEAHLTWSRLLGLCAAWQTKIPLRIGFEQGDIYLNSWKFRLANFVGQYWAHHIIVCSQALKDWVCATHKVSPQRIKVFHNCVDVEEFTPSSPKRSPDFFHDAERITVFCAVGSLGRGVNKRMDICIRALHAARQQGAKVGLLICGDGEQRPELEELTRGLGVARYIKFLGVHKDVPTILAGVDAFCHAAPFEPFGIVCVEAMASGIPVCVPDSGGIAEAVDDGVTGLVYPVLNHAALAKQMCRLHNDPQLRENMGKNARKAAEEHFDVKGYVQRLYQLYGMSHESVIY